MFCSHVDKFVQTNNNSFLVFRLSFCFGFIIFYNHIYLKFSTIILWSISAKYLMNFLESSKFSNTSICFSFRHLLKIFLSPFDENPCLLFNTFFLIKFLYLRCTLSIIWPSPILNASSVLTTSFLLSIFSILHLFDL